MSESEEVGIEGNMNEAREAVVSILGEIKTSNEKLVEISDYCQQNFQSNPEVFQQTKSYAADALLNAAYQAHRGAESLMDFLDSQMKELDQINASVNSISLRYQGIQDSKPNTFVSDIVRTTADAPKVTTEEVGESKRQNNRSVIDFTALDDVGVSF